MPNFSLLGGRLSVRSVIHATDLSEGSLNASLYAKAMAMHFGAMLEVMHVFEPSESAQEVEARDAVMSQQRIELQAELDRLAQSLVPQGGKAHSSLLSGNPAEVIPDKVSRLEEAILVLGTHGRNSLDRHLLGSVAEGILTKSAIPTLTVGPKVPPRKDQFSGFRNILYATDCSLVASQAAPFACALASSFSGLLEVLTVVADDEQREWSEVIAELDFRTVRELSAKMADRCNHFVKPRDVTPARHAREEILKHIETNQCDLLVLGIERKSSIGFFDRGSAAFELIAHASCPVLTITEAVLKGS